MRSITGWIGKLNPVSYAIRTPTATIGVRGTDHEPHVILPPEPGQLAVGEPGTYDKVNQGSTVMKSDRGSVVLQPNQAGFAAHGASEAPKMLPSIPGFYKPSKREGRIERRKEMLSQNMDRHHAARVQQHASKNANRREKKVTPRAGSKRATHPGR